MIADFRNIPIDNVNKFVPNIFDKDNFAIHYGNLQIYLNPG